MPLRCHPLCYLVFALLLCSVNSHPSQAVDKTWDDGGPNNFWDEDENWDPDEKPQPTDKAIVGGNPEVNTLEIFNELENEGTIDITTGTLQPQGDTDNTGTINVGDGSAIVSQLIVGSSTTLSGSGEVVLNNSDNLVSSNAIVRGGNNDGVAVTNGAGHTIRGEGSILQHWINDGTIRAEETSGNSTAVLRFDNGTLINNGNLQTSSGASIELTSYTLTQGAGGSFTADTLPVVLQATTIVGGSLETAGGGNFQLAQGNNVITLSGVTINAPINNVHTVGNGVIRGNSAGITNNSTITLDGAGGGALAQFGFVESGSPSMGQVKLSSKVATTTRLLAFSPALPLNLRKEQITQSAALGTSLAR